MSDDPGYKRYNRFLSRRLKNCCFSGRNLKERRHQNHTITEYELLRRRTKIRKQAAERFLSGAVVYSFDSAAKEVAMLFEELCDSGKMINENDLLIAGISLAHDEALLTRDKKLANIGKDNIKIV